MTRYAAITLALLIVGLAVRGWDLEGAPRFNETADEFAWTWSGMSLVQDGVPRSWSWYPVYDQGPVEPEVVVWRDMPYRMVEPCVDHPPLYSSFMGLWMTLFGFRDLFSVDLRVMRSSSLLLFGLSFLTMSALLARLVSGPVAIASLASFAVAGPAVLQGRLVLSEQLLTLLILLCLLGIRRYEDGGSWRDLAMIGLTACLLPLTKIAGLSLCFGAALFAAANGRWRAAAAVSIGTVLGALGVVLAGVVLAGDFFWVVLSEHSGQFMGFFGAIPLLFSPKVVDTALYYGPYLLGPIALLGALIAEDRAGEVLGGAGRLALVMIGYVGAMSFFINQNGPPGWYRIPLYPLFSVGLGVVIIQMWAHRARWPILLWVLLVVPILFDPLLGRGRGNSFTWTWEMTAWRWLYLAVILAVPMLALLAARRGLLLRRAGVALLLALQVVAELNIAHTWVSPP